jgi:uncharacterized protein (UPF0332 family)
MKMPLADWAKNGWLRPHSPSKEEIANLFEIVERDLKDATAAGLSDDWKFGIAYNAALKLCTILLHSSSYRAEKNLAHYRTLQALPEVLGKEHKENADYLDACRKKRNETEYDFAGGVSAEEVAELLIFCQELKVQTKTWLKKHHPKLF